METPAEQKSDSKARRKKYVSHAHQLAKEYLLANPTASNEEVVKALGVSPRAVSSARSVLVNLGYMQRNFYDRRHRPCGPTTEGAQPSPAPPGPIETTQPLTLMGGGDLQTLESAITKDLGPALTTEQMRQRYSAIARWAGTNKEFTLEISAMQALGRLDAQSGARDKLGPGVPLTRTDKVERVGLILEATGPSIAAESLIRTFDRPEIDRFIDELGRFMARKAPNGLSTPENSPQEDGNSPPEVPSEVPTGQDEPQEAGPGDSSGPRRAEEDHPGAPVATKDGTAPSGTGESDGRSTPGPEGG